MAEDLETFYRAEIAPHRPGITRVLRSERQVRSRILANVGVHRLLSTLHPQVHWSSQCLDVPGAGGDVRLDGAGLSIAPSYFLPPDAPMFLEARAESECPVLFYPLHPQRVAFSAVDVGTPLVSAP